MSRAQEERVRRSRVDAHRAGCRGLEDLGPRQRRRRLPTKPYDFGELLARLRAVMRRGRRPLTPPILRVGPIELDTRARRALRHGDALTLTAREYTLLEHLVLHTDEVVGRAGIAEHVWDEPYEAMSNVIDVLIQRLRRRSTCPGTRP